MAMGKPAVRMFAALRRREYIGSVFDRPGAQQHLPVGLAGRPGEGRRHGEHRGTGVGQVAIELRETQIVAHGHAQLAPWCLGHHSRRAGLVGRGFAVGFAVFQIDVEHMDLVVMRPDRAGVIDQKGPVGDLVCGVARQQHRQGSAQQPYVQLARQIAKGGQSGVRFLRPGMGENRIAPHLHHRDTFWESDEIGAVAARRPRQPGGGLDIRRHLIARIDLNAGKTERRCHPDFCNRRSSSPLPSSAASSSDPPIGLPSIKICGTVRPPPDRSVIC